MPEIKKTTIFHPDILVLDFDGVILESVNARDESYYSLFSEYGERIQDKVLQFHLDNPGIDRAEKIRGIYLDVLGNTPDKKQVDNKVEEFGRIVFEKVCNCEFVRGIPDFLSALRACQNRLSAYIVSAARQDEIARVCEYRHISEYFKDIYGGPKKKTELINGILALENKPYDRALFIGDKISDYSASLATGVRFLGRAVSQQNPFPENVLTFSDFSQIEVSADNKLSFVIR